MHKHKLTLLSILFFLKTTYSFNQAYQHFGL